MHFKKEGIAILNKEELCPIDLQNVQESDITDDDISNNAGNKIIIPNGV